MSFCSTNADAIDSLGYIWQYRDPSYQHFFVSSHVAAYDESGYAIQCGTFDWPSAKNMGDIDKFLNRIRLAIGLHEAWA